jgi:acyl carrier protein/polyketide biosynthesis acyl carrier protein
MTSEDVRAIVLKHLHQLVPGTAERALDEDAPLNEIGADSLDLVDVASRSMQDLSVRLPRTDIGRIKTFRDLVRALHEKVVEKEAPGATAG